MARIQFDPAKDQANVAKHGISLARAEDMDVLAIIEDDRFDYGEQRFRAFGLIDDHYHCLVFAERNRSLRAISLRRAHAKEIQRYVKT
jgi:uncharacterized protein